MTISLFIADDHAMFRDGLRLLLGTESDIVVAGEAGNGLDTVRQVSRLQPDVVLMDISMPELNGIDATEQICSAAPQIKVIILSMYKTSHHIYRAFKAGARGYVLKESAGADILKAIRAVHTGKYYTSEAISHTIIDNYVRGHEPDNPLERLSAREREVLQLLVEGYSNARIAERLFLSQKTVETYRSHLMQKLGLTDLPSLVKFAIQHGVTSVETLSQDQ